MQCMMEDSRRVTAATAQTPQLLKLGAHLCSRKSGAINLMNRQEYPIRITIFALSASMSPELDHRHSEEILGKVPMEGDPRSTYT